MATLKVKGKGTKICIVPLCENLTPEVLRYGSQNFYPANIPFLVGVHQTAPHLLLLLLNTFKTRLKSARRQIAGAVRPRNEL